VTTVLSDIVLFDWYLNYGSLRIKKLIELRALHAHMPTCPRAYMPLKNYVPTCFVNKTQTRNSQSFLKFSQFEPEMFLK